MFWEIIDFLIRFFNSSFTFLLYDFYENEIRTMFVASRTGYPYLNHIQIVHIVDRLSKFYFPAAGLCVHM